MLFMNKEIFLIPNILSIVRLIAVIPVGYFLFSDIREFENNNIFSVCIYAYYGFIRWIYCQKI